MNREYFSTLYEYNYWANERVLGAADKVTEAQFTAKTSDSHGSLRGTLVHTLSAESVWLLRWNGISPTSLASEGEFPNLAALRTRWREEEAKMRAFLGRLTDQDFMRVIEYKDTRGMPLARPLWQMLAHLVNHGTQHRAEAAAILTNLGYSPGGIDFVRFLDEGKK